MEALDKELDAYEIERMLGEENDKENAIVYINAGAGGTEAQDWAEMLLPHVPQVGREERIRVAGRRSAARRGGRDQERDVPPEGRLCLRLHEVRERNTPPGAHLAL